MKYDFIKTIKVFGYNTSSLAKVLGKSQTAVYQSLSNPNVQLSTLQQIADICTQGNLVEFINVAEQCQQKDWYDHIFNIDYKNGLNLVPNKSIDLVLTDPPYLFVPGGGKNPRFNLGKMACGSYLNEHMSGFGEEQIEELLNALKPKFKKTYNAYFFCSELQLVFYLRWAFEHKLRYNVLIWDRQNRMLLSQKFFRSNIDYIVRIYGSGQSLHEPTVSDGIDKIELYSKIKSMPQGDETEHETEKPVQLLKDFINLSSNEGDVVLDPFIGSGSTVVACLETKRHYIGFEINKQIYEMAQARIDNGQ